MNKKEEEIFLWAEKILAMRIHSSFELEQKLRKKFPNSREEIDEVIAKLKYLKILNDVNFARDLLNYLLEVKPQSQLFLRRKMQEKGLLDEIISAVMAELEIDELEIAIALVERKMRLLPFGGDKEGKKNKVLAFLQRKGFSFGIAQEAFEAVYNQ